MSNLTDYIPHGLVAALGSVVAWVYNDHAKRDDRRFEWVGKTFESVNKKLDEQNKTIAQNHAEILRLLLDRKNG